MKTFCAFWQWNRRVSHRTMTPARVSSGKVSAELRTLRSLQGKPISFLARRRAAKAKRDELKRTAAKAKARKSIRTAVTAALGIQHP